MRLLTVLKRIAECLADTGWIDITPTKGTWNYLQYRKIGTRVTVRGYASFLAWAGSTGDAFAYLPTEVVPPLNIYGYAEVGGARVSRFGISAAGRIYNDWTLALADGSSYTTAGWYMFRAQYDLAEP